MSEPTTSLWQTGRVCSFHIVLLLFRYTLVYLDNTDSHSDHLEPTDLGLSTGGLLGLINK